MNSDDARSSGKLYLVKSSKDPVFVSQEQSSPTVIPGSFWAQNNCEIVSNVTNQFCLIGGNLAHIFSGLGGFNYLLIDGEVDLSLSGFQKVNDSIVTTSQAIKDFNDKYSQLPSRLGFVQIDNSGCRSVFERDIFGGKGFDQLRIGGTVTIKHCSDVLSKNFDLSSKQTVYVEYRTDSRQNYLRLKIELEKHGRIDAPENWTISVFIEVRAIGEYEARKYLVVFGEDGDLKLQVPPDTAAGIPSVGICAQALASFTNSSCLLSSPQAISNIPYNLIRMLTQWYPENLVDQAVELAGVFGLVSYSAVISE